MLLPGLDGSYHPESGGTLMGAAMSVAKNVASNTSTITTAGDGTVAAKSRPSSDPGAANGAPEASNRDAPKVDTEETALPVPPTGESNGLEVEVPPEQALSTAKSEPPGPTRKSSFIFNFGGGKQSPERGSVSDKRSVAGGPAATDRRGSAGAGPSSRGSSPADASGGGSGPIVPERPSQRKKSSECYELLVRVWVSGYNHTVSSLHCF